MHRTNSDKLVRYHPPTPARPYLHLIYTILGITSVDSRAPCSVKVCSVDIFCRVFFEFKLFARSKDVCPNHGKKMGSKRLNAVCAIYERQITTLATPFRAAAGIPLLTG